MSHRTASYGPAHPWMGKAAFALGYPLIRLIGKLYGMESPHGRFARERLESLRRKLDAGETAYLLGIGPGGHNSGAGLLEVSRDRGIRILSNHEEERFRGIKHYGHPPEMTVGVVADELRKLGVSPADVHCACTSWDYPMWGAKALQTLVQELPGSAQLLRTGGSPHMNVRRVVEAFTAPKLLGKHFDPAGRPMPAINLRHHDNHAWMSWGVSPFASSDEPVMVLVVDGSGDDGAISMYVVEQGRMRMLYCNDDFWDSLGLMYGVISASQGGWPPRSSEGRYMGAAAWGNMNRLTNPYYTRLREIFVFESEGRVFLNRALARWHHAAFNAPYSRRLTEILGPPILPKDWWHPDAVLHVEDIQHAPVTAERVDKAAAVQLVFEDALFHLVGHLIRTTRSTKLVLTGGSALNCVANMRLLEFFNREWYERYLGMSDATLHLWVPPVPGDQGVAIGAAYHFACLAGARPGESLQHAFYCGLEPTRHEIESALSSTGEIGHEYVGNILQSPDELQQLAELLAILISHDCVVGLFQGAAETGPRALGHRSILANPANPRTLETINQHVKFRELIRPLAPMATLEAARRFFDLAEGADDDNYNAYNYMVLTAMAAPEAYNAIPAVIHKDGTSRVQIVRSETDPFIHAYLKAMGRRIGAEVSVNTSLNVGAPIAQTPGHALETLKKSKGMHALFLIAETGETYVAWHNVESPPKDAGRTLRRWMDLWRTQSVPVGQAFQD